MGAILYEWLTGRRAFRGETPADTISAILHRDPPEFPATNRTVPPALERIMRHCLEKNPEERFQSARDVAFDLESATGTSTTTPAAEMQPRRSWRTAAAFIGLVLLVAIGTLAGRTWLAPPANQPDFRRLTFRRGSVRMARFAPDGQTIVYGAAWDGKPVELFALRYETSDSRALDVAGQVLSMSTNGEVALLLNPKVWNFVQTGTLAVMPLRGGAPRELWLLPLAVLVYRSRFLPRFLGVWLVINGFAYVIMSFTGFLLPQYQNKVFAISQPALFGEVALMLWLVIKGAKPQPLDAAASPSVAV